MTPAESAGLSILHVLAPAPFGGLERVVQSLARGQRNAGNRVEVAAVGAGPEDVEPFLSWFRDEGISARHLAVPERRYLRERRLVRKICAELRPVVHTHGYRADVIDGGVGRAMGLPTVTTAHGFTGNGLRNRAYEWLQRRAFRKFDAVVAVARSQLPVLRSSGVSDDRMHLIPNALDAPERPADPATARERLGVRETGFHVGWVGRLSREKGPDVLLEALTVLRDREFVASIIGDGPLREALIRRAADTGLAERIRWHGVVPRAATLLRAFDVLVLSSRTEGTPMVLLEGMHAGVPIVATRVGGIPDVVSREEALLVPPEDPAALAEALEKVRRHPDAARDRASAARRRVRTDFTVTSWVRQYDRLYRRLVEARGFGRSSPAPSPGGPA